MSNTFSFSNVSILFIFYYKHICILTFSLYPNGACAPLISTFSTSIPAFVTAAHRTADQHELTGTLLFLSHSGQTPNAVHREDWRSIVNAELAYRAVSME